jgi:hypothetical protein
MVIVPLGDGLPSLLRHPRLGSAQMARAGAVAYSATAPAPPGDGGSGSIPSPSALLSPTLGSGVPILVITDPSRPFTRYYGEILRAEGLNAFTTLDLSGVTPDALAGHDVVLLGETPVEPVVVGMLSDWVASGGTLIAMRPDVRLARLLGLEPATGTLADGYLLVNTASGPGMGIVKETIQFHGTADHWMIDGAEPVATLYADSATPTEFPAVTEHVVGSNGGRAIAFTYDLARSVVYTRQGNPEWAGQKRDGQIPPKRASDMFFGNAAFDPEPDWVDLDKVAIPQADEQQRLLANAIIGGNLHRKPLPRFWYLPRGLNAAIVMTGDNHGDRGMQRRFDIYRAQSPLGCSVEDWECVRATGYLYVGNAFTPAQARFYDALGFEVALHVDTDCENTDADAMESRLGRELEAFRAAFPSIPSPTTSRTHCVAWSDWSTQAEIEATHGIRLDTNYYYWPAEWVRNRPGLFTGSGIPMRFARLDGSLIDCYQAPTQMPDESGLALRRTCDELLDRALGDQGYYGVFVTNLHFDQPDHPGSNAVVASAQAHGVPVVSARQLLSWLDGRNASSFRDVHWSGGALSFQVEVGAGARNLRAMLPARSARGRIDHLTRNGTPLLFDTRTIKGIEYALFPAAPGEHVATYSERSGGIAHAAGQHRPGRAPFAANRTSYRQGSSADGP